MRIESFYIDGFGHFTQTEFGPFNAPITIFLGENEAGKTTLLAFIRTILFGFPRSGRNDFYPPLKGGTHGGHIVVIDENGTRYTIERFAAAKGGTLSVRDDEGKSYSDAKLRELVGHSSKELFENVFAFGLDELQDIKSLNNEEVQGRIYSAGLGVTDLPKAVRQIEGLQGNIYRHSGNLGSTQEVVPVLLELESVDAELSVHYQDAPRYAELLERTAKIRVEISDLEEKRVDINSRLDQQRKLHTVRDELMEIGILEDKLSGLPQALQFPQGGVARLETVLELVSRMEEDVHQAVEAVEKLQRIVDAPLIGRELLESSAEVRKAMSERARLSAALRDLPERKAEADQQGADVARQLKELGTGWDLALLETIDVSLPSRDKVNQEKARAAQIHQALNNRQTEIDSAENECQSATESKEKASLDLEQAGPPEYDEADLAKRRGAISTARNGLARISESNRRRAELRTAGAGGPGLDKWTLISAASIISFFVGIGFLVWSFIGNGGIPALIVAVLVLVIGLGLVPLAVRARRSSRVSIRMDRGDSEMKKAEDELSDAGNVLGVDSLDFNKLELLSEELEASAQKLAKIQNLERALRDAVLDFDRRGQNLERANAAFARLDDERIKAEDAWVAWLRDRHLVETMSADGVLDLFSRIETARVSYSSQLDRQRRVSAIEHDIIEISELVGPLAASHGVSIDVQHPTTLIPVIDELSKRLESGLLELSALEANRALLTEAAELHDQERRQLEAARRDLIALMLLVETDDVEEFRRLGSVDYKIQTCLNDLDRHVTAVRLLFGPNADVAALRAEIGERSSDALSESVDEEHEYLKEVELSRDSQRNDLTLAERELAELGSSDESSDLLARRESLVEELLDLGSKWSIYSLALMMLQKTRDRHERERQPQVIQSASEFFKNVTGGKYQGLRAPAGESVINAVTGAGVERKSSQLSRGTKEQMYLAIRFGLVREFSQQMTSLPIIVDDALVNSDPRRARAGSEGFASLVDTNQVLIFTCHPNLIEHFQEACLDAEVYNLATSPEF